MSIIYGSMVGGASGTDGKSAYAYAVEAGKYYSQGGAVYLCTRDTVNPVYNALADLVGLYVEIS